MLAGTSVGHVELELLGTEALLRTRVRTGEKGRSSEERNVVTLES